MDEKILTFPTRSKRQFQSFFSWKIFVDIRKRKKIMLRLQSSYPNSDHYINDAFFVSHRKHATVVGIPKYLPSFVGTQLISEIKALSPVVEKPMHPLFLILGGAKFATKIPLLSDLLLQLIMCADCRCTSILFIRHWT